MPIRTSRLLSPFLLFIAVSGYGQALQKIDSLKSILATYAAEDTVRVNLLNAIGFEYWTIDAIRSETFGKEALALAEEISYSKGLAMANRVIGVSHWARGNYFQALTFLFKARETYISLGNRLGEANATMNIGMVYADQSDYQRSLQHYFNALSIFETLSHNEERLGTLFTKIGAVYCNLNEYEKSYEYFIKSLDIHQSIKYTFGVQEICNFLGIMYLGKNDWAEAQRFFEQSLVIAEQRKDNEHIAKNLESLAKIYLQRGEVATAEQYLHRAYRLSKLHGNKKILFDILADLRQLALTKNDYRKAIEYFQEYEIVKDSLFNNEKSLQISNLAQQWEEKEKEQAAQLREQEIMLLQQQSKTEKLINFSLTGAIGLILVIGYMLIRNQRFRIKKNHELLLSSRSLYQSQQRLAETELENTRLKEKELRQELELRNRELTSYALNFIQKNELLDDVHQRVKQIKAKSKGELNSELNSLLTQIHQKQSIDRNWTDFKRSFEQVHPDFFNQLMNRFPELSSTELRHCALIRLNLGTQETASLLGISMDSLKTSRYRLRKKLNLTTDQGLEEFLIAFQ